MDRTVVIIGAQGMLGHALMEVFNDYNPIGLSRDDLDITDQSVVRKMYEQYAPDIVINAAAYTDVDGAEENHEIANEVNGTAIGYLAAAAKQQKALLIHFSTDYVFPGVQTDGYQEDDVPQPVSHYGWSKLLGEQEVQEKAGKYYLIRTSWLYGPHGKNFVDTILTKAEELGRLKVVNDQHGKPTYTLDLALQVREMIERDVATGVYHITNATPPEGITWYDFAKKAIELKGVSAEVEPCETQDFPRPANRPEYGMLVNTKLDPLRQWDVALKDYLQ